MSVPLQILLLDPNFQPPAPVNRTYTGPLVPLAYDVNWQEYGNLSPAQIAWFQAQPEWQNFLTYIALDPANATIHASIGVAGVNAKLQLAGKTLATAPLPILTTPPTPGGGKSAL